MDYYSENKMKSCHLQHRGQTLRVLCEQRKAGGERKILYDFTSMWNLKNKKKEMNRSKQTKMIT